MVFVVKTRVFFEIGSHLFHHHNDNQSLGLKTAIYFVLVVDIFTSYFLAILFNSFTAICNSASDFAIIHLSQFFNIK
jgi:hypothetical protein